MKKRGRSRKVQTYLRRREKKKKIRVPSGVEFSTSAENSDEEEEGTAGSEDTWGLSKTCEN